jgi:hypothetical protein
LVHLLPPAIFVGGLIAWGAFALGGSFRTQQIQKELSKQCVEVPEEFQTRLGDALLDLRQGRAEKAFKDLGALEQKIPRVSSLTYLAALAAMQAGNTAAAAAKADESITKRERISDSLALRGVLETRKKSDPILKGFGDPRIRAEEYFRKAMIADAANPFPCVELATLLRYGNRRDEALKLMQAARARLNPVDSHSVVDAVIALMTLEAMPEDKLPTDINPDKDVASMYSAAYVAMRKHNYSVAADLLRKCRNQLPADLNFYLVQDLAFREYARQPEIAEFFP